jgi:broad specificity phosphatase PhoE
MTTPATQKVILVRHGETEWSLNGRHTSTTDIPLTALGEQRAAKLQPFLSKWNFGLALCSPRLRARRTCELAGWSNSAEITEDLSEWNYGDYEGLTTPARMANPPPMWALGSIESFQKSAPQGAIRSSLGMPTASAC